MKIKPKKIPKQSLFHNAEWVSAVQKESQSVKILIRPNLQEHKGWTVEIHDSFMKSSACCRRKEKRKTSSVPKQHAAAIK